MAPQFRALLALGEDLTSVPSDYMVAHNYQLLWFQGIPHYLLISKGIRCARDAHTYMYATHIYKVR